jgi:hypothetical protein
VELTFLNAVVTPCLLFRTQLQPVFGSLLAALTVLARGIGTTLHGTFARVATLSFKEQLFALAAAQFADRTGISCHVSYTSKLIVIRAFFSGGGSHCAEWGSHL